jgi:hypothetical protein
MNDPSSRIMRLKLKLQEFEYTIVYKRGKENGNSDGMSRMFSGTEPEGAVINALTREFSVKNCLTLSFYVTVIS